MQGIILAAGKGTRLEDLTQDKPKPLIEVDDRSLIDYAIALLRALGIADIIVVGGKHFSKLKKYVDTLDNSISIIENKKYEDESLASLAVALPHINESFFQVDVDFIYTWDIVERIKEHLSGDKIKAVGTSEKYGIPDDMVKIQSDKDGCIQEMAKDLINFGHGYVGMMYCGHASLIPFKNAVSELMAEKDAQREKVWSALPKIARVTNNVFLADIGKFNAVEVDTKDELETAENFVKLNSQSVNRFFV